jgi:hypothetical protein
VVVLSLLLPALELPVWQGTLYLKLHPSSISTAGGAGDRPTTSKALLAKDLRARLEPTAVSSLSLGGKPTRDLHEEGPVALDLSDGDAPWLHEKDWVRFESGRPDKKEDLLYAYAGTCALMSRDFLAFPFSAPGRGALDVIVQEIVRRFAILLALRPGLIGHHVLSPCRRPAPRSSRTLQGPRTALRSSIHRKSTTKVCPSLSLELRRALLRH